MANSVQSLLALLFTLSMADISTAIRCFDDIVTSCHITDPSFDPYAPSPAYQACIQACKECELYITDQNFQPYFNNYDTFVFSTCTPAFGFDIPDSPPSGGVPSGLYFFLSLGLRLYNLLTFLLVCGCCLFVRRRMSDNVLQLYGLPPDGTYYGFAPFFPDTVQSTINNASHVASSSRSTQKEKGMGSSVPLGDNKRSLLVSEEDEKDESVV